MNGSPTLDLRVHTDNSIDGFPHDQANHPPGTAYERTVTGDGVSSFYCHNNGETNLMAEGGTGSGQQNYLRVVP